MDEFRVSIDPAAKRSSDRKIRLAVWGTIPLFLGACAFAFYGTFSSKPQLGSASTWVAISIVVGATVGAYLLAVRLGLGKLQGEMTFLLTDHDLTRRRKGWPDVIVGFSEIEALRETDSWLIVESVAPKRRIAIPAKVEGFPSLRTELAKHCPITTRPSPPISGFVSIIASLLCWGIVLLSGDPSRTRIAAGAALVLLAWESVRLYRRLRESPSRSVVLACLVLSWVVAILLVYFRTVGRFR
jgi:hypothetical protein